MKRERLWKVAEVASFLGVHHDTIYSGIREWRETGKSGIEYERVGKRGVRIPERVVLKMKRSAA